MKYEEFVKMLIKISACKEAIKFVKKNKYNLEQAWNNCEKADWLLWFACKMEYGTKKERIHAICDCTETALKYVPKGEDRPRKAIEAIRKYADNPTEKNNVAGAAAWAAEAAARATEAAAWAAGVAAEEAAWAAVWAAEEAAWAAGVAVRNAARATGDAVRNAAQKKMCKLIRKRIKLAKEG